MEGRLHRSDMLTDAFGLTSYLNQRTSS